MGKIIRKRRQRRREKLSPFSRFLLSDVPYTSLTKIETGIIKHPSLDVVLKLSKALGISLDNLLMPQVFHGTNSVLHIWQDILTTLKAGDSMLISGIDETMFLKAAKKELLNFISNLKKAKLYQKLLVVEGDTNFLKGDHLEYRAIPKSYFSPTPIYVYANKVSFLIWEPVMQAIIIENSSLAEAYRKQFLFVWDHAKPVRQKQVARRSSK